MKGCPPQRFVDQRTYGGLSSFLVALPSASRTTRYLDAVGVEVPALFAISFTDLSSFPKELRTLLLSSVSLLAATRNLSRAERGNVLDNFNTFFYRKRLLNSPTILLLLIPQKHHYICIRHYGLNEGTSAFRFDLYAPYPVSN